MKYITQLPIYFLSSSIYIFSQIKKHPLKEHMRNFKIGKITYSKS